MPRRLLLLVCLLALTLAPLTGCFDIFSSSDDDDDFGGFGPTITSVDGNLTVTYVSNLPNGIAVSIEKMDSGADPALVSASGNCVYKVSSTGGSPDTPAIVRLRAPDPTQVGEGTLARLSVPMFRPEGGSGPVVPPTYRVEVNLEDQTADVVIEGVMDLCQVALGIPDAVDAPTATLTAPEALMIGEAGVATVDLAVPLGSDVHTNGAGLSWQTLGAVGSGLVVFSTSGVTSYAGGAPIAPGGGQMLSDARSVIGTHAGNAPIVVRLTFPAIDASVLVPGLAPGTAIMPSFEFEDIIAVTGTGGVPETLVFPIVGVSAIEAMRTLPDGVMFGQTSSGVPAILVAGSGGAQVYDPGNGTLIQSYPFAGEVGFDASILPIATDPLVAGLFITGLGYRQVEVSTATGEETSLTLISPSPAFYSDQTLVGNDAANGSLAISSSLDTITWAWYGAGGSFQLDNVFAGGTTSPLGNIESAVANASLSQLLIVRDEPSGADTLVHADRTQTPAVLSVVGSLGEGARRIRWDPASGVGAVSNAGNSTLSIFHWTGSGLPTLTDKTAVPSFPVGIDVKGMQIVAAGFDSNTVSLVTVDSAYHVLGVQTQPLPSGVTNPGHAAFLGGGTNGLVVSGNGSNAILYISDFTAFF